MFINIDKDKLKDIKENWLWLIMDPWENQSQFGYDEDDVKPVDDIDITSWNAPYMEKLIEEKLSLKHSIIVTDYIKLSPSVFHNSLWVSHGNKYGLSIIKNYMREKKLKKIIYCGFHEQACVLHRNLGLINMSKYFDCYIFLDLVCPFPEPNWEEGIKHQRNGNWYKYIRVTG